MNDRRRRNASINPIFGLAILILLAGCSSMSVFTDYGEGVDFSEFQTFQYRASDTNLADSTPLVHQRIVAAIEREMTASGLTRVDGDPDVFVSYYGSTTEQLQFRTTYTGVSTWGRRRRWGSVGMAGSTTRASTFEEGSLIIDVWEADENQLVWRGEITHTLSDNPDRNTEKINNGISKAFRDFPPSQ